MHFIEVGGKRLMSMVVLGIMFFIGLINAQNLILSPVEDVYIVTYGGGEGCNPFLKYDISSIPPDVTIDSVFLMVFVWEVNTAWDGDVDYWNLNNQIWTEDSSAAHIWNAPTSDLINQVDGFGMGIGWIQSVDLKNILLTDYNAGNQYCSIKMKDPDDPTFNPIPGSFPVNSNDTLSLGNRAFGEQIYFYPREFVNAPPWLHIYYTESGIEENGKATNLSFKVYPNPFRDRLHIVSSVEQSAKDAKIKIYNVTGCLVKNLSFSTSVIWDGTDESGHKVPAGVYLMQIKGDNYIGKEEIILLR